ncbi:MAG: YgfZ/GcvT domain-containing protein [Acidobacteriota bacterium]
MESLDRDFHESRGGRFLPRYGRPRLVGFGPFEEEYAALETGAVLFDLSDHSKVIVSGEDRGPFLNGLVTQKILDLREGSGRPACFLDRRSRILAEVRILALEGAFLLEGEPGLEAPLCERLRKFRLSSRVEVKGLEGSLALLSLQGPAAGGMAQEVLGTSGAEIPPYGHTTAVFQGVPVRLARIPRSGRPGLDFLLPPESAASLWRALCAGGATPAGWDLLETARTEAGLPRFGADLTEEILFSEACLPSHLSLDKGCFVGQEVVARVRTYGNLRRLRTGLLVDGPAEPGDVVRLRGKEAARLTTARFSPLLGRTCAFAYLPPGLTSGGEEEVTVEGPQGTFPARPAPYPFL